MEPLSPAERARLLAHFSERFGIAGLERFAFVQFGKGRVHLMTPEAAAVLMQGKGVVAGLPCCRLPSKPATVFLQLFGSGITKNTVDLDAAQAAEFIRGRDVAVPAAAAAGYVAVRFKGRVLGCGLLKTGVLKSQVPRAKRLPGF